MCFAWVRWERELVGNELKRMMLMGLFSSLVCFLANQTLGAALTLFAVSGGARREDDNPYNLPQSDHQTACIFEHAALLHLSIEKQDILLAGLRCYVKRTGIAKRSYNGSPPIKFILGKFGLLPFMRKPSGLHPTLYDQLCGGGACAIVYV